MGMAGDRKKLPVGIEDFAEIRTADFYYVDKTGLLRDLLRSWGKVNLFTRPRRFGKSLNMSMLRCFFEIGSDKALFDGLKIMDEAALCDEYMGQFPVISISLKSVNGADFATARSVMCSVIGYEALRFRYLLDSPYLGVEEKRVYRQLIAVDETNREIFTMSDAVLMGSLKTLALLLQKHYGKKVILLIDEYDVPLAKANEAGYYDQMAILTRNLFEQTLKTNESLYFAVLTGCLRVSKESIFTGLNNPKVSSITSVRFDEYFGFTDEEIKTLLNYYGISEAYELIREWYDGYHFGDVDVYCPWDVVSYCDERIEDPSLEPQAYWSNTSGNDIVSHFIKQVDHGLVRREVENLLAGETVTKEIRQELTYKNLYDSLDNLWSVLFTTGYLTQRGRSTENQIQLAIPNRKIRKLFTDQIMELFKKETKKDGDSLRAFCDALQNGAAEEVERLFTAYLSKTISIRDTFVRKPTKENFYHGILFGILGFKNDWYVKSNKGSGDGYSDILIEIEDTGTGIVLEVKYAENAAYETVCREALRQIEVNDYAKQLREDGMHTILKYGIACYKKRCKVILERYVCTNI